MGVRIMDIDMIRVLVFQEVGEVRPEDLAQPLEFDPSLIANAELNSLTRAPLIELFHFWIGLQ